MEQLSSRLPQVRFSTVTRQSELFRSRIDDEHLVVIERVRAPLGVAQLGCGRLSLLKNTEEEEGKIIYQEDIQLPLSMIDEDIMDGWVERGKQRLGQLKQRQ